jgi:HAD superfamily hydrolase (TIGR01549 family)
MEASSRLSLIELVIFDMDGTLTVSGLDFDAIRRESGVPGERPVLEHLSAAGEAERRRILEVLERHEAAEAEACESAPGAAEVIEAVRARGLKTAILSRNSRRACERVAARLGLGVDAILGREDAPPKPSAASVGAVCRACGVEPARALVVGDYVFDIEAGRAAGALTALVRTERMRGRDCGADFELSGLADVLRLLDEFRPGGPEAVSDRKDER